MRQDLENSVRGLMKPLGLRLPRGQRAKFAGNVRACCEGYGELQLATEALLQARQIIMAQIKSTEDALLKAARNNAECRRLMTIPGVGPMTAMAFLSTIDNIENFPKARSVGAFFGLTPRRYQSGKIDYHGRICKRGDSMVRKLLYEAANAMLTVSPKFSTLKAWGLAVAKRSGMRKERVAVARKLAVIMATMLRDRSEFRFSTKAAVIA